MDYLYSFTDCRDILRSLVKGSPVYSEVSTSWQHCWIRSNCGSTLLLCSQGISPTNKFITADLIWWSTLPQTQKTRQMHSKASSILATTTASSQAFFIYLMMSMSQLPISSTKSCQLRWSCTSAQLSSIWLTQMTLQAQSFSLIFMNQVTSFRCKKIYQGLVHFIVRESKQTYSLKLALSIGLLSFFQFIVLRKRSSSSLSQLNRFSFYLCLSLQRSKASRKPRSRALAISHLDWLVITSQLLSNQGFLSSTEMNQACSKRTRTRLECFLAWTRELLIMNSLRQDLVRSRVRVYLFWTLQKTFQMIFIIDQTPSLKLHFSTTSKYSQMNQSNYLRQPLRIKDLALLKIQEREVASQWSFILYWSLAMSLSTWRLLSMNMSNQKQFFCNQRKQFIILQPSFRFSQGLHDQCAYLAVSSMTGTPIRWHCVLSQQQRSLSNSSQFLGPSSRRSRSLTTGKAPLSSLTSRVLKTQQ